MVQEIQRKSSGYTLDVLKNQLRPREAVEIIPGGDKFIVSETVAPTPPAAYLILMYSQSVGYPSYPALYTLMTRLSMTLSSCRPAWRMWRPPSTPPH